MKAIDKFTESRIKISADIMRVFEHYKLPLKKIGDTYFTSCPFHTDKHPSMSIDLKRNCWYCWACSELEADEKHDHIGFVMKYEGVNYAQALERLAEIYGIIIPENGERPRGWTPPTPREIPEPVEPEPTYTNPSVMYATMRDYENNPLFVFMSSLFDPRSVYRAFMRYNVGTAKHKLNPEQRQRRSTVFWQVDAMGRVRSGKIFAYSEQTGKRIKRADSDAWGCDIYWTHKLLRYKDYRLEQCLFGAHLITDATERVNVVESEKSALLASLFYGDGYGVWVAACGKTSSVLDKILEAVPHDSTRVVLYPDADAVAQWAQLCENLKEIGLNAEISNIMGKEPDGSKTDIGDFIISEMKARANGERPQPTDAPQTHTPPTAAVTEEPTDYAEPREMGNSMRDRAESNLYKVLASVFDPIRVDQVFTRYNVGSEIDLEGSTSFWQVDERGRIRVARIVSHDARTGRRVRNPDWCVREDGTCWHYDLPLCFVKYNLRQCLFGQHLLSEASRVYIVEEEETALLGCLHYGDASGAWAATGTADPEQCAELIRAAAHLISGKEIVICPSAEHHAQSLQLSERLRQMGFDVDVSQLEQPSTGAYDPTNPGWVLNPVIDHGNEMPF